MTLEINWTSLRDAQIRYNIQNGLIFPFKARHWNTFSQTVISKLFHKMSYCIPSLVPSFKPSNRLKQDKSTSSDSHHSPLCVFPGDGSETSPSAPTPIPVLDNGKVNFLGMSLDGAAAAAGQWVLLVLGLVLLVATILLGYKNKKSKRRDLTSSELELK